MKGKAYSSSIESVTRQKPYDTLFFKQVGVKPSYNKASVKHKTRSISASDGCSTSHVKSKLSSRLIQPGIEDRALRAMCEIVEETSNVDELHATREKTLHVQNSRTAEVTICIIPERTARSLPTVIVRLCRHCKLSFPVKGIEPTFPTKMRKVERRYCQARRRTGRTQSARCPTRESQEDL